jgi:hypothetical protein
MTALTPALALDYLKSLSADYRSGVVLGSDGTVLAGDGTLAMAARTFTSGAETFAARDGRHTILVTTGPHALPRLTRHDLCSALVALGGDPNAQETSSQTA